jgi:hypothetical protein
MTVKVDPRSLRPIAESRQAQEDEERSRLEAKAANRLITESPDGRKVVEIITRKLLSRITKVLEEDPESRGLLAVLQELGATERTANMAVETLVKRFLHIAPKQGVL